MPTWEGIREAPFDLAGLMKLDLFLVSLILTIVLALIAPQLGTSDGPLQMGLVTDIGIGLIFFLHGAAVSSEALRTAAGHWRLHGFIQATTFLLFPAVGLIVYFSLASLLSLELRLGFFFLCVISSTISSSVAMTAMARGNVPAAVFNATFSGLLGMVLTPLLMGLIAAANSVESSVVSQIGGIFAQLLLPFAAGQILRPLLKGFLDRFKSLVGKTDRLVILMIVYTAFCNATEDGLWTRFGIATFGQIIVLVTGLLALTLVAAKVACRAMGFTPEDEAAAIFCGCTKSLANGAPIAKVIFGASPALPLILLPLLFYHQLQLIVFTILARHYAARQEATKTSQPAASVVGPTI